MRGKKKFGAGKCRGSNKVDVQRAVREKKRDGTLRGEDRKDSGNRRAKKLLAYGGQPQRVSYCKKTRKRKKTKTALNKRRDGVASKNSH